MNQSNRNQSNRDQNNRDHSNRDQNSIVKKRCNKKVIVMKKFIRFKGYRDKNNIYRSFVTDKDIHLQCKMQTYVHYASYPAAGALLP